MELQGGDFGILERGSVEMRRESVLKWNGSPASDDKATADPTAAAEPPTVAGLDFMRKAMLVLAGVLTLVWLAVLARGAVWVLGTLFF